jgi:hypothetical protein
VCVQLVFQHCEWNFNAKQGVKRRLCWTAAHGSGGGNHVRFHAVPGSCTSFVFFSELTGKKVVVFFLVQSIFRSSKYFIPEYVRYGLVYIFAHIVESACLLFVLFMACKQFARRMSSASRSSVNLDESLLGTSETEKTIPKIYDI